jgi:putative NADH-flavin reductase
MSPTSKDKVPSLKLIFGGLGSLRIKPVNQLTSVPESLAIWKTTAAPTAQFAAVVGLPIVINSLYLRGIKS